MNSNPDYSPNVARPSTPRGIADVPEARPRRLKSTLIAVGVWQLACLGMMFVYGDFVSDLVVAAYTLLFGDIQASSGNFARFATYIRLIVITLPASALTIALVDKLSASKPSLKRKLLSLSWWQIATIFVLGSAYEFSLHYMISQLYWRLFGLPAEIYSFQNLILPRIIGWLLCTTPLVWLAAWTYSSSYGSQPENSCAGHIAPVQIAEPSDARETSAQSNLNPYSTPRSP